MLVVTVIDENNHGDGIGHGDSDVGDGDDNLPVA